MIAAGPPQRQGRIIGRLGSRGTGTVHAGLDPDGLRVAVKVIHAEQAEDPEFRARFRREVQLSARVQGPCFAAEPNAEFPWLATAYASGPTLNQHPAAHGPLAGGTLYAFAAGTAQALEAIHASGAVHRDVKPQDVILTPAGPRVLDFGIAHAADGTSVTRTGVMTGTPRLDQPRALPHRSHRNGRSRHCAPETANRAPPNTSGGNTMNCVGIAAAELLESAAVGGGVALRRPLFPLRGQGQADE